MAQPVLWQLVNSGQDPFSAYAEGAQQYQKQKTILEQLAGQREDRQFARDSNVRDFQFRTDESRRTQQNADRQFGFTQTEAQRAQSNADRQFGLQERVANEAQITQYEMPDGTKIPIRVDRQGNAQVISPPNLPQANPVNPYAPTGKTTDDQAKAGLYATRMANANDILGPLDNINKGFAGSLEGAVTNAFPAATNVAQSADRQKVIQAQRDFINAVLRRESGAVISESEFVNARQQYFPQPGDTDEVIRQKAANRLTAIHGIMGAAGKNYQPPANYRQQNNPNNPNPQANTNPPMPNQPKVQIGSQEEYARLPSGALFIMNGKSYQKP